MRLRRLPPVCRRGDPPRRPASSAPRKQRPRGGDGQDNLSLGKTEEDEGPAGIARRRSLPASPEPIGKHSRVLHHPFSPCPAPLWRRFAAGLYDLFPLTALWFLLAAIAVALNRGQAVTGAGSSLLFVGAILLTVLYLGSSFARGGQTLGMRAWRIRLEDEGGAFPPAMRAYARAAAGVAQVLPLAIGLWWALLDRERRSLADRLCGTRVVLLPSRRH